MTEEKYRCDFGSGWDCIYSIHNCSYSIKGICLNPLKNYETKFEQAKAAVSNNVHNISDNIDHLTDNLINNIEDHLRK